MNWINIKFYISTPRIIQIINTRKVELIGKLRVVNSQWEIDAEYYEEVMQILNELKLEVHESVKLFT
jgi:dUTPase